MKKVAVFLADGFEEVEALTVVDLLRRAEINVDMVSIEDKKEVRGRSNIIIRCDSCYDNKSIEGYDGIVLPGGMPGTNNLMKHQELNKTILDFNKEKKLIAAICAAPIILGELGILKGKYACCYPGFEDRLHGAIIKEDSACIDGNIITSRGLGTAIMFALEIITFLISREKAEEIRRGIVYDAY